jgi:hypothetical protein
LWSQLIHVFLLFMSHGYFEVPSFFEVWNLFEFWFLLLLHQIVKCFFSLLH